MTTFINQQGIKPLSEEGHFIPPRKSLTTEAYISLELLSPLERSGYLTGGISVGTTAMGVGHTSDYTCAIF